MNNFTIPNGIVILVGVNLLLAIVIAILTERQSKRFVLTPIYQVVPKGSVWTAGRVAEINAEMPNALEEETCIKPMPSLGSTLTVDDVIKGVGCYQRPIIHSPKTGTGYSHPDWWL